MFSIRCPKCGENIKINFSGQDTDCQGCKEKQLREKEIKKKGVFNSKNHYHLLKFNDDMFIFDYSTYSGLGHKTLSIHPNDINKIELNIVTRSHVIAGAMMFLIHTNISNKKYDVCGPWTFEEAKEILEYLHENYSNKFEITEVAELQNYSEFSTEANKVNGIFYIACFSLFFLWMLLKALLNKF